MKTIKIAFVMSAALACMTVQAIPVNGTGDVNPDVIFGSGNANGDWTGTSAGGIEVALRGKLRYDLGGSAQNIFNYDGVNTYTFNPALSNAPANRSIFNFEWAVNSNDDGVGSRNVNAIDWLLTIDVDPTIGVANAFAGDPINVLLADHSFGNNATGNGAGVEAANAADYATLIANNNVAQQSWNLGFGFSPNPQAQGLYTFTLTGSDSTGVLASTSINIQVGAIPAPEPATLTLAALALGMVGSVRRRRKDAV